MKRYQDWFLVSVLCLLAAVWPITTVQAEQIRQLNLATNWLDYDPTGKMLYISRGSGAGSDGNSITPINPLTGALGTSVFVGSEPERMVISDNGEFLYVYLGGSATVRRVHLPSQTPDLNFPLGSDSLGAWVVDDMEVVPGHPRLLMATMKHPGYSPRSAGTAVYDEGVRRPDMNFWGNTHTCTPDGTKAFIFHNETTGAGLWMVDITPTGVRNPRNNSNVLNGFGIDGRFFEGLIYANNSRVYDPVNNVLLGAFTGGEGLPIIDAKRNRAYFLNGWGNTVRIVAYDRATFLPVGTLSIPGVDGGTSCFVPCGEDGFAFRTGKQIFIVRTELRAGEPEAPTDLTAALLSNTSARLSWTDNSLFEAEFAIERRAGNDSFVQIAKTGANTTSYVDSGLSPATTYTYRVRALNNTGPSAYSNPAAAITGVEPPAPPTRLAVAALSKSSLKLTWTDTSTNESGFKIERKTGNQEYAQIATAAADSLTFTDLGLTANTTYTYRARSYNADGDSAYSAEASGTTMAPEPPAPPTRLAVAALSKSSLKLTWTDASTNESGFKIERKTGSQEYAQIATVPADSFTFTDVELSPNTPYTYRARAYNADGDSVYSAEASGTTLVEPPPAPADASALGVDSGRVEVSWADRSTNETGFRIERRVGSEPFTPVGTVDANRINYTDPTVTAETTYTYRVLALNAGGPSGPSNESAVTPPAAPGSLAAAALSSFQVRLSWSDRSGAETAYSLERQRGSGGWTQIAPLPAGATSYLDEGAEANVLHRYRVRALNPNAFSSYSDEVSLTPLGAPQALAVVETTPTTVRLAWRDESTAETGFDVERKTPGGEFVRIERLGANATTYTDAGLMPRAGYSYRVRALNSAGFSSYSNAVDAVTRPLPPQAPADLVVTSLSRTELQLTWSDRSDQEDGFKIERRTATGRYESLAVVGANVTRYTDANLAAGATYVYQVRAYNTGGDSPFSNEAGTATLPNAPIPPAALTATVRSTTQVDLAWSDRSDNEMSFKIERAEAGAGYAPLGTADAGAQAYSDTTARANTTYTYRVRSVNAGGDSLASNEAVASTPPNPPDAPAGLRAQAASESQVELSWTDASGNEDGFKIERRTGASDFVEVRELPANTSRYTDAGLNPNTRYVYRVRAFNRGGASFSNEAEATTGETVRGTLDIPRSLAIGPVRLRSTRTGYLMLRNLSRTERLRVTLGSMTGPFLLATRERQFVLAPGARRSVPIVFRPIRRSRATGTLRLTSSDPRRPSASVGLVGTVR